MAIKKINIKECPFCGGTEFTHGVQKDRAAVISTKSGWCKPESLYHIFCTKCGSVVRSYIYNPEKMEPYPPEP